MSSMNIYAIIILATIVLEFILSLVADILNLRALSGELPKEFEGIFDADAYCKSQEYTRTNTRFGFVTSGFSLVVTLAFWFGGGFNYLDTLVRAWDFHPIITGMVYIGILILARGVVTLPFSIYATFVIEERFGFNKTTPSTFIKDIIKGILLSILIGAPLLSGVMAFFQYAGSLAWLYCWIVTIIFALFIQFIAPTWIMPLFNKFKPLKDDELRDKIMGYAQANDFPLQGVYEIDGSRRSTKSNAFFTGFGKNKRIALYDTLIEKHTVLELVAVLAHEIGHYKKKHIIKGIMINILHMGVMFFLLSIFISHKGLFDAFYMAHTSIYAGLIFFGMLYAPIELILSLFLNIFSRKNEYEADHFAAESIDSPENMVLALKKLSLTNLSNLRPHPFYVFLHYSHPTVLQRIRAIRQVADDKV